MTDWQQFCIELAKAIVPLAASVLSFVLGWWLNGRTDERKEESIRAREEIGRRSERGQKREDRREAFELEVTKELHTALLTYARSEYLVLRSLEKQADENGAIRDARIGSQEDSDALVATQDLSRLEALVLDDDIRASVKRVKEAFGRSAFVRSLAEAAAVRADGVAALEPAQQKVGERIRQLYLGSSTFS
ncbi:hypothetical protein ACSVHC_23535 [Arthrobacter sp. KNU-44]|uniref:hypothetical protein n=1 Tax=Arthrobacter sp. KNU-44 TaxID=3450744 RepID=UPI003F43E455